MLTIHLKFLSHLKTHEYKLMAISGGNIKPKIYSLILVQDARCKVLRIGMPIRKHIAPNLQNIPLFASIWGNFGFLQRRILIYCYFTIRTIWKLGAICLQICIRCPCELILYQYDIFGSCRYFCSSRSLALPSWYRASDLN